jgi:hypothetical protein
MVKQTLFPVLVHCKHTLDQGRLTWRHDSVLNHIAGCLKSALVGKSTVELFCDLDRLQAPGGGSISADVMVQAQRPDLVNVDWSVHGRRRIALVKLICPWDTDAKRAEERKTARYADLKEELSNQGWDCGVYLIEAGAAGAGPGAEAKAGAGVGARKWAGAGAGAGRWASAGAGAGAGAAEGAGRWQEPGQWKGQGQ